MATTTQSTGVERQIGATFPAIVNADVAQLNAGVVQQLRRDVTHIGGQISREEAMTKVREEGLETQTALVGGTVADAFEMVQLTLQGLATAQVNLAAAQNTHQRALQNLRRRGDELLSTAQQLGNHEAQKQRVKDHQDQHLQMDAIVHDMEDRVQPTTCQKFINAAIATGQFVHQHFSELAMGMLVTTAYAAGAGWI